MPFFANLPGIFGMDGLIIFLFLLLFFGAKKLPELARGLGSAMREFSKAKDEIQHEITREPSTYQPKLEAPAQTQSYQAHATTENDYHQEQPGTATPEPAVASVEHPAAPASAPAPVAHGEEPPRQQPPA